MTQVDEDLTRLVGDPAIQSDPPTYRKHTKAIAEMQDIVVSTTLTVGMVFLVIIAAVVDRNRR